MALPALVGLMMVIAGCTSEDDGASSGPSTTGPLVTATASAESAAGTMSSTTATEVPDPPTSARPLEACVGSYANDFFGTFEVVADGTGLALVQGPARVTSPLTHWDGDIFTFIPIPESPELRSPLTFTVGPDGAASAITIADPDFGTLQRE